MSRTPEELDPLGAALCAAAPPPPSDLVASVMARLEAEAGPPHPAPRRHQHRIARRWRLAVAALVVSVPLSASVGAARASTRSLPDEPLYGIRSAREALALALAPDQTAHDALALGFAQDRIADLQRVLAGHAEASVTQAIVERLLAYDRLIPAAHHVAWLCAALHSQYRAVQRAQQQVVTAPAWRHDSERETIARALANGSTAIRALARADGAKWAQAGPDIPAQAAGHATGP